MKRIAIISDHASPLAALGGTDGGGQNVYVGQLARRLQAFNFAVDVYTRRHRPDLPEIVPLPGGVRVIHVPAGPPRRVPKEELLPFMGEFISCFLHRAARTEYDLIHANFFLSALVAAEAQRLVGTPFVVTFHALGRVRRKHQGGADTFPPERLAIEDRAVAAAQRVIAECPQDEEDLLTLYHADPARVVTIPCGFDPDEFWPVPRRTARSMLGLSADERVIVHVGRLVPRKGVDNVIRGLARLRSRYAISARLLVVGGETAEPDPIATPEIGRLRAVADVEGVSDLVTFVGSRGREVLRHYYSAADVFVTTPWYEPFGITPLEAMACATPVIGSAVGGIRSTVKDGETGYLVPPNDPLALADRLARVLLHPALARTFGRKALRRAGTLYTWDRVVGAIAGVYADVLGEVEEPRAAADWHLPRRLLCPRGSSA